MRSKRAFVIAICVVLAFAALASAATAVTLDGITPSSADRGTKVVATVSGSGFVAGATVALSRNGTWIPAVRSVVESPTTLVCLLAIPADAPAGTYTLNFMNGGLGPCVVYQKHDAFTVLVPTPGAVSFTADPPYGTAPLTVQFRVTPTPIMSPIAISYKWDFGDGTVASGWNPVHTYTEPGRYLVTLAVGDATGRVIGKATGSVWVTPGEPPIGGDKAFFLVSTTPPGAGVYTEDIAGTRVRVGTTTSGPVNVTIYLTGTPVKRIIANLSGYRDAVYEITQYPEKGQTVRVHLTLEPIGTLPGPKALIGTWRLTSFLGANDVTVPALVRPVPFITFSPDGSFSGSVGCNHFGGTYTATDDEITFSRIVSTEMYCLEPAGVMDQEQRVFELLPLTVGYRIDEQTLTLFDRAGRSIMTFERVVTVRPQDPDGDGKYDDMNGNGRLDFNDVVMYFNGMSSIAENESVTLFDYNGNGRIDFADVLWLFNHL